MNSRLKVGDRVMVYGWVQMHHMPYKPRAGGKATVVYDQYNSIRVRFDNHQNGTKDCDPVDYLVHHKQCRRLVKNERMRICILEEDLKMKNRLNWAWRDIEDCGPGYVQFIEMRKK